MLSGVARLVVNPSSFVTSCVYLPTRAPSLLRHYSLSSVLRAHPPPKRPGLALTNNQLIPTADHRLGFPCCVWSPMHACCCHYPGRVDEPVRSYCCIDFGLPHIPGGSAPASPFSRPARHSHDYGLHARRVACATLYTGGFSRFVASTTAPIATGWSEPVPGWEFHPLLTSAFHGAQLLRPNLAASKWIMVTSNSIIDRKGKEMDGSLLSCSSTRASVLVTSIFPTVISHPGDAGNA